MPLLRVRQMLAPSRTPEGALAALRQSFEAFVARFFSEGPLPYPLELKRQHSARVAALALRIAQDLEWQGWKRAAAEGAGWLHDLGRFTQFARFQTFQDHRSLDHGEESFRLLEEGAFLDGWPPEERLAMASAVRFHNKRLIPEECPEGHRPLARLVRDADKLDVFEVVQDAIDEGRVGELLSGLTPDLAPSPDFLAELSPGPASPAYGLLSSLGDFLLLQLSWVYDMNYAPSFRLLRGSGVLDRLTSRLPATFRVQRFIQAGLRHVVQGAEGTP